MVPRAQGPLECLRCNAFGSAAAFSDQKTVCGECGRKLVDVTKMMNNYSHDEELLAFVPIAVCRELCTLPYLDTGTTLVLVADFFRLNTDTKEQLRFILNRSLLFLHAESDSIQRVIQAMLTTRRRED